MDRKPKLVVCRTENEISLSADDYKQLHLFLEQLSAKKRKKNSFVCKPKGKDYSLNPGAWAGAIGLPDSNIIITPKIQVPLLYMLFYSSSEKIDELPCHVPFEANQSTLEQITTLFLHEVESSINTWGIM